MAGLTKLISRGRALNWIAIYEVGMFLYRHGKERWENLSPDERRSLGQLLRKSKGLRSNLSGREQDRLWELVKKAALGPVG